VPIALPTVPEPVLRDAVRDAIPFLERVVNRGYANSEGGDVANDLAASAAVFGAGVPAGADLLDVGCGTAALSAWLADRHGLRLHLSDHDPGVLAAASASFDVASTTTDLAAAPRCAVVTAMEVLEHVPPASQPEFVAALLDRVAPGGVLVLSTPDESHYPGGWSGYAPHVGCVDAARGGRRRGACGRQAARRRVPPAAVASHRRAGRQPGLGAAAGPDAAGRRVAVRTCRRPIARHGRAHRPGAVPHHGRPAGTRSGRRLRGGRAALSTPVRRRRSLVTAPATTSPASSPMAPTTHV
jgi:SAM-dependent methyltransferase